MQYDPEKHHRRSIRLEGFDYSQPGWYFITLVTHQRKFLFGKIIDAEIQLSDFGKIVEDTWLELPDHNPNINLDYYAIMPNHFHGIIQIVETDRVRAGSEPAPTRRVLPEIVRQLKTFSAKRINQTRNTRETPVWQRNYYERIIRDEPELNRIRKYIIENPLNWQEDKDNK